LCPGRSGSCKGALQYGRRSQAWSAKDAQEVAAAKEDPVFRRKVASLAASGNCPQNVERDFVRLAERSLGIPLTLCPCRTYIRSTKTPVVRKDVGFLAPFDLAHALWTTNPDKFRKVFALSEVQNYWIKTIEIGERWFQLHPMAPEITAAIDKTRYLPLLVFGDDGTLRKSRAFSTMTWYSALAEKEGCLHSRLQVMCCD
jgi:hypothetical protein